MTELLSLPDGSTISNSMSPIYTGLSAPLALTATGLREIIRRTESESYSRSSWDSGRAVTSDEDEDEDEKARGRLDSPARANSKRRMSASAIHCLGILDHSLSQAIHRITSMNSKLAWYDRSSPSFGVSCSPIQYRATSGDRSPSRGRTRRREETHPGNPGRGKYGRPDERSNISRRRQHIQDERISLARPEYSSSPHVDAPIRVVSSYVTKGAFRLQKYQGPGEFRFPKSKNQQEPTWRPGDGFSDDEVKPGFISLMAGKRKRKRSRSLSAFGQLSLETENITPDSSSGMASSQPRLRERRAYRTEVTDPWPTRENFMEDSITNNAEDACAQNYGIASSAPQFIPSCPPMSTLQTKQAMPRRRRGSDFENFGKHVGKSQSCHKKRRSFIFTTSPQGYDSEESDEENREETNGLYENVEGESEQSLTDEELENMSTIIVEGSDNGSVILGEDNLDEDEVMQSTIQDSQPDEIRSGRFEVGEKFEAYLLNLSRRLPSDHEAATEDAMPQARLD